MHAQAVVFDLGNVLIRWDPHPAIAAGVGEVEATRLLSADDFDFTAWNHAQDAGRGFEAAEEETSRTHPHWAEHVRAYRAHFGRSLLGPIEPHVAVLRELHAAGVPVFGLTNWSAELFPVARERFDFLALLADVVVSGEEGLAKPDPAIFEVLRRRTGCALEHCVFLDDSAANVGTARSLGMDAVHVTDGVDVRAALRDRGLPLDSRPA